MQRLVRFHQCCYAIVLLNSTEENRLKATRAADGVVHAVLEVAFHLGKLSLLVAVDIWTLDLSIRASVALVVVHLEQASDEATAVRT